MRQIKFKGVFKVRDNDYYSEDEKNYIESKQHEILSISIGSHCTIAYQDTVMTVFEMRCSNYDLLQFTGLVDRNGKEIYENDIVSFPCKRRNFLVMWNDDLCVYQFSDGSLINSGDNYSAIIFVIGNAFDNPELLNEKQ